MLTVDFEREGELVYISNHGDYDLDDVVRAASRIIDEHSDLKQLRKLSDLRHGKLRFQWYSVLSQLSHLRRVMAELTSTFQRVDAAIVFSEDANKALIKFFMQLRKPENYQVRICETIEEAREWLKNSD